MNRQIGICDDVSIWNAICVPILLHVLFHWISVNKLWDMIIRLCMFKGRIVYSNVLDFQSHGLMINEHDIILPGTVKLDNWYWITAETHLQYISHWCHPSHGWRGQSETRSGMNDDRHAANDYAYNSITLFTDLVHMFEILNFAYIRLRTSRRMSGMRKSEEVGLNTLKTSVQIYMRSVAGRKHWNVIGQRDSSLR